MNLSTRMESSVSVYIPIRVQGCSSSKQRRCRGPRPSDCRSLMRARARRSRAVVGPAGSSGGGGGNISAR